MKKDVLVGLEKKWKYCYYKKKSCCVSPDFQMDIFFDDKAIPFSKYIKGVVYLRAKISSLFSTMVCEKITHDIEELFSVVY